MTPSAVRLQRYRNAILAILVGLAAFFVTRALVFFIADTVVVLRQFGLHSPTEDFDFLSFFSISALSLGFNACICCALGLISHRSSIRHRAPTQRFWAAGFRYAAIPSALLLGWLLLFNLPRLIPTHGAEHWYALVWPPESFFPPIRLRLLAFYPLGNLGALTGFALGMLVAELRARREDTRSENGKA